MDLITARMISFCEKLVAAGLEALLDHDAYALDRSARLSDNASISPLICPPFAMKSSMMSTRSPSLRQL